MVSTGNNFEKDFKLIEGFLLLISVGAIVWLMYSLSRTITPPEVRNLGIFSYKDDMNVGVSISSRKGK